MPTLLRAFEVFFVRSRKGRVWMFKFWFSLDGYHRAYHRSVN